jgi:hypothetical protein
VAKPGATLAGHGIAGNVAVLGGGTLSPGGARAATLDTGSVLLHPDAHFVIQLGAHRSDQLDVSGHVQLGDTALDLSLLAGFQPAAGGTFEIIANDGSDPVHGRFAGLPQGAKFSAGGEEFSINYHGGHGNAGLAQGATCAAGGEEFSINYHGGGHDVVVTALGPPSVWADPAGEQATHTAQLHLAHGDLLFA